MVMLERNMASSDARVAAVRARLEQAAKAAAAPAAKPPAAATAAKAPAAAAPAAKPPAAAAPAAKPPAPTPAVAAKPPTPAVAAKPPAPTPAVAAKPPTPAAKPPALRKPRIVREHHTDHSELDLLRSQTDHVEYPLSLRILWKIHEETPDVMRDSDLERVTSVHIDCEITPDMWAGFLQGSTMPNVSTIHVSGRGNLDVMKMHEFRWNIVELFIENETTLDGVSDMRLAYVRRVVYLATEPFNFRKFLGYGASAHESYVQEHAAIAGEAAAMRKKAVEQKEQVKKALDRVTSDQKRFNDDAALKKAQSFHRTTTMMKPGNQKDKELIAGKQRQAVTDLEAACAPHKAAIDEIEKIFGAMAGSMPGAALGLHQRFENIRSALEKRYNELETALPDIKSNAQKAAGYMLGLKDRLGCVRTIHFTTENYPDAGEFIKFAASRKQIVLVGIMLSPVETDDGGIACTVDSDTVTNAVTFLTEIAISSTIRWCAFEGHGYGKRFELTGTSTEARARLEAWISAFSEIALGEDRESLYLLMDDIKLATGEKTARTKRVYNQAGVGDAVFPLIISDTALPDDVTNVAVVGFDDADAFNDGGKFGLNRPRIEFLFRYPLTREISSAYIVNLRGGVAARVLDVDEWDIEAVLIAPVKASTLTLAPEDAGGGGDYSDEDMASADGSGSGGDEGGGDEDGEDEDMASADGSGSGGDEGGGDDGEDDDSPSL